MRRDNHFGRWLGCSALLQALVLGVGEDSPEPTPRSLRCRLGDGTEMPVVGLGTWKSAKNEVIAAVYQAICISGYRHIDAAQIYHNHDAVGQGIRQAEQGCRVPRRDIWVTSKLWMTDFSPADVPGAVDRILRAMGLSYLDQLLLHWPTPFKKPPPGCPPACPPEFGGTDDRERPRDTTGNYVPSDVPLADTWYALQLQKAQGKVRSIGVSNFEMEDVAAMTAREGSELPAVNQVEMHVFWNQANLRAEMKSKGIMMVAYSPLGNPAIYGEKVEGMKSKLVTEMAAEVGMTPAQVMLNYLIAVDAVVVPKSVTQARIDENINFTLKLTPDHIARLERDAPQGRLANPKNRPGGKPVFSHPVSEGPRHRDRGDL